MLKIRLRRVGAKKKPQYRVVVADARAPRDGAFVEILGQYNPRAEAGTFAIDEERTRDWLSKGAQPTERVAWLLGRQGVIPEVPRPQAPPKETAEPAKGKVEKTAKSEAAAKEEPAPKEDAPLEETAAEPEANEPAAEAPGAGKDE